MPGLVPRLTSVLQSLLPPGSPLNIVLATDPALDAWKGMAAFSQTEEFARIGMTKQEYEEYGGERVKKWWGGNWNGDFIPSSENDRMQLD